MLYVGRTVRAPTTITAATHCCTSNLFALIVCSQIPSINGQITNRYNQLTANSWRQAPLLSQKFLVLQLLLWGFVAVLLHTPRSNRSKQGLRAATDYLTD